MTRLWRSVVVVLVGSCGCSGDSADSTDSGPADAATDQDGGDASQTGALAVTINAPAGITPDVEVSGPGGFQRSLTESETFDGLPPGTYAISAHPVRLAHDVVDDAYVAAGGDVDVTAGRTATFTVEYELRSGSGLLWVAVWGSDEVIGYARGQLADGGDGVAPSIALGLGAGNGPYTGAFDREGNYWVGTQEGLVLGFAVDQLSRTGAPRPAFEIVSGSSDINGLAFDADGNLWVSAAEDIRRFDAAELMEPGGPTPAVIIAGSGSTPLAYPAGVAFDSEGALWVAAPSENGVYAYGPSQLTESGSPDASVAIRSTRAGSLDTPRGVAFDGEGALWVANWSRHTVVKFEPGQLAVSGRPAPAVTIQGVGVNPLRLAFDGGGNLWCTASWSTGFESAGQLTRLAAVDLVSGGVVTPEVVFTNIGGFDSGGGLAFDPAPEGLPLAQ